MIGLAAGLIGVALLKRQGLETLTRGMQRAESGEVPIAEMAEGILLAVAGALLLTPGFVTDAVGFTLLFPPSRAAIASHLIRRVTVVSAAQQPGMGPFSAPPGTRPDAGPRTIEGEFEKKPE